ncbi:hypothetical protein GCM10027290_19880 [Micromonospora sonneratiae]|uniref:Uncharacterized protein n=1 Tax=Micromonospora sonneratiae TaxID=1184706 RepID=A0ABW3YN29_9ACTN
MDRTLIGYAHQSMAKLKKEFAAPTSAVGWAYGGESETDEIILISGASGTLPDPKGALERLLASLPRLKNVRPVDPGPLGGEASCGSGETTNAAGIVGVTSCAWVDAGSIGLVTFMSPGRSSTGRDRSAEFVTIRGQIQQRTS